MTNTIVDINILQTVPPSNVNRDDTGSPKTATFGGTRRARVSSQAWKRATRLAFNARLDPSEVGIRTKRLVAVLAARIAAARPDLAGDQANKLAKAVFGVTKIKLSLPRGASKGEEGLEESGYLLFLSSRQLDHLARLAIAAADSGDLKNALKAAEVKNAINGEHSIDIALFGRMVADAADLNVDAAVQVAHAISVHPVETEFDYFTAVDDAKDTDGESEDAGAAMIGTVEFNSSTLYRYATININGLQKNLGSVEATEKAVEVFLDAFARSMPTGKQNTFANRTLPDAVWVAVRDSQPVNLVGAFEETRDVDSGRESRGRLARATARLVHHARDIDANYGTTPVSSWVVCTSETAELAELGTKVTLEELAHSVASTVAERITAQS